MDRRLSMDTVRRLSNVFKSNSGEKAQHRRTSVGQRPEVCSSISTQDARETRQSKGLLNLLVVWLRQSAVLHMLLTNSCCCAGNWRTHEASNGAKEERSIGTCGSAGCGQAG
jgi:hypothetical protein